jgi:hypothetical protein
VTLNHVPGDLFVMDDHSFAGKGITAKREGNKECWYIGSYQYIHFDSTVAILLAVEQMSFGQELATAYVLTPEKIISRYLVQKGPEEGP